MARHLIVVNETLGGEGFERLIRERTAQDAEFHVLVPAAGRPSGTRAVVAPRDGMGGNAAGRQSADIPPRESTLGGALPPPTESAPEPEAADSAAQDRLMEALDHIRRHGADVDGEIGPADVLEAIDAVLARRQFDEIILATLSPGPSKLVGMDLVSQVERRFDVPVTHTYGPEGGPAE